MKSYDKQFKRAADDVAERVRKLLADIRPAIQAKHQLTGMQLDLAFTQGVGVVVVELAKIADMPLLERPATIVETQEYVEKHVTRPDAT